MDTKNTQAMALSYSGVDRSGIAPDSLFVGASTEVADHQHTKQAI